MGMRSELEGAIATVRSIVGDLVPENLAASDAATLVSLFATIEHLGAAGKALAARRVAASGTWKQSGQRSAAHWLATTTAGPVSQSARALATAERLEHLGTLDAAVRAGEVSAAAAAEIASVAHKVPDAQAELIEAARTSGFDTLLRRCREVLAAHSDSEGREKALHARRFAKLYELPDGMTRLIAGFAPAAGARFGAILSGFEAGIFENARRNDRRDSYAAYVADALLAMAEAAAGSGGSATDPGADPADGHPNTDPGDGEPPAPPPARPKRTVDTYVHVLIDREALLRGWAEPGETCEIAGVGPVAASTVATLIESGDAFLTAVVRDGVDVFNVAHLGRKPTAYQRTALVVRDGRTCVVAGCEAHTRLEIDHVDDWSPTRITTLRRLALLCPHHHRLKTRHSYKLVGEPGAWRFLRPDGTPAEGLDPP